MCAFGASHVWLEREGGVHGALSSVADVLQCQASDPVAYNSFVRTMLLVQYSSYAFKTCGFCLLSTYMAACYHGCI